MGRVTACLLSPDRAPCRGKQPSPPTQLPCPARARALADLRRRRLLLVRRLEHGGKHVRLVLQRGEGGQQALQQAVCQARHLSVAAVLHQEANQHLRGDR